MLDPGRYFAEAIYFLQYTLAQILWAINRATLSVRHHRRERQPG
jgi:hypothetical protein